MAELKIEFVKVDALTPHPKNSKIHDDDQLDEIVGLMKKFGWTRPVITNEQHVILAGHGATQAAVLYYKSGEPIRDVPFGCAPVVVKAGLSDAEQREMVISENKTAENSKWNNSVLASELLFLRDAGSDLVSLGFEQKELDSLLVQSVTEGLKEDDDIPDADPEVPIVSVPGDIWLLGEHRVMCGDSVSIDDVHRLANGEKGTLLHADPPYGMGKESDGVANDNLYNEKLDLFQLAWFKTFRPHLDDNASAYIWGTAPDLWRLWYSVPFAEVVEKETIQRFGLCNTERLTFRNEIIWDKLNGIGMRSELHRQFPTATERCLFFMFGMQYFGNVNTEDFFEGWEPFRAYLEEQTKIMGWGAKEIKAMCGVGMYGHWFTKCQWTLIPEKHYNTLKEKADGKAFDKTYQELKDGYKQAKDGGGHLDVVRSFNEMRAYFDNAHDNMTDVWQFPRVIGEERFEHATPKPVAMMERVLKSSAPKGSICFEPFGGTGSTLIGAEKTGRRCYTMELKPVYVDVIVRRWQEFTGKQAKLEGDGRFFHQVTNERTNDGGKLQSNG